MDRKELNEENIKLGRDVLAGLDQAEVPVIAAFWLLLPETEGWRYVIATKLLDELGPIEAYGRLQKELINTLGKDNIFIKYASIVSPAHPLVGLLKAAIRTDSDSISGIRFTGNVINGQYIEDAYIYRVS